MKEFADAIEKIINNSIAVKGTFLMGLIGFLISLNGQYVFGMKLSLLIFSFGLLFRALNIYASEKNEKNKYKHNAIKRFWIWFIAYFLFASILILSFKCLNY